MSAADRFDELAEAEPERLTVEAGHGACCGRVRVVLEEPPPRTRPRMVFAHVQVTGYIGSACKISEHADCPGGWPTGCSTCAGTDGTPCACSCHVPVPDQTEHDAKVRADLSFAVRAIEPMSDLPLDADVLSVLRTVRPGRRLDRMALLAADRGRDLAEALAAVEALTAERDRLRDTVAGLVAAP